ncbi:MAG: hypothetical protein PHG80_10930 [Methanoregulaceae archaeon]|nr:hypothetical protein [Methanoregulaceae archaeon]
MRSKKSWKDREGTSTWTMLGIIIVVIAVILCIIFVAYMVTASDTSDEQEDQDKDGDGEVDPLVGYIKVTAKVKLDNSAWLGSVKVSLSSVKAELMGSPDEMSFSAWFMSLFREKVDVSVKFTITNPVEKTTWSHEESISTTVEGQEIKYVDVSPDRVLGIRYHNTYHITATLYDAGGNQLGSLSIDEYL